MVPVSSAAPSQSGAVANSENPDACTKAGADLSLTAALEVARGKALKAGAVANSRKDPVACARAGAGLSLTAALEAARGKALKGSLNELSSKRLCALNLRKLGAEALSFVPRCYILVEDEAVSEFGAFVADFQLTQALAILKRLLAPGPAPLAAVDDTEELCHRQEKPEGLWGRELPQLDWRSGPDPTRLLDAPLVGVAAAVVDRALKGTHAARDRPGGPAGALHFEGATNEEWEVLASACAGSGRWQDFDGVVAAYGAYAASLLSSCPEAWQVSLCERNLWISKPSTNGGGNGRGILLLDRLPASQAQLLQWAAAVGRSGGGGISDARDGCVLQKLVENPQLLDRTLLMQPERYRAAVPAPDVRVCPAPHQQSDEASVDSISPHAFDVTAPPSLFKYNLRMCCSFH